jgi:hypothetical protein
MDMKDQDGNDKYFRVIFYILDGIFVLSSERSQPRKLENSGFNTSHRSIFVSSIIGGMCVVSSSCCAIFKTRQLPGETAPDDILFYLDQNKVCV